MEPINLKLRKYWLFICFCFIDFIRRIMIFVHSFKCTRWLSKHTLYLEISVKLFHVIFKYTVESFRRKLNDYRIILCKNYSAIKKYLCLAISFILNNKIEILLTKFHISFYFIISVDSSKRQTYIPSTCVLINKDFLTIRACNHQRNITYVMTDLCTVIIQCNDMTLCYKIEMHWAIHYIQV